MLKYKQWKQLNESFLGPVTLGLGNPQNLGITGNNFTLEDLEAIEEAAKKKGKKKMDIGDLDGGDVKIDKVHDDEEELDDDEDKEFDAKKKVHDDEEELEGDDEDLEGEEDDEENGGVKAKKVIDLKGDEGGGAPMFAKKGGKGKKGCGKSGKGKKGCGKSGKGKKCESAEEQDWWNSLTHQLSADPNRKFSDGTEYLRVHAEDAINPPSDPNAELISDEPGPGEVGFAPENRVGGTNPLGGWAGYSQIDYVDQAIREGTQYGKKKINPRDPFDF